MAAERPTGSRADKAIARQLGRALADAKAGKSLPPGLRIDTALNVERSLADLADRGALSAQQIALVKRYAGRADLTEAQLSKLSYAMADLGSGSPTSAHRVKFFASLAEQLQGSATPHPQLAALIASERAAAQAGKAITVVPNPKLLARFKSELAGLNPDTLGPERTSLLREFAALPGLPADEVRGLLDAFLLMEDNVLDPTESVKNREMLFRYLARKAPEVAPEQPQLAASLARAANADKNWLALQAIAEQVANVHAMAATADTTWRAAGLHPGG